jgi:hypothetical protein
MARRELGGPADIQQHRPGIPPCHDLAERQQDRIPPRRNLTQVLPRHQPVTRSARRGGLLMAGPGADDLHRYHSPRTAHAPEPLVLRVRGAGCCLRRRWQLAAARPRGSACR